MAETRWISVGALAQAFETENNTLPPTGDLVGKAMALYGEEGTVVRLRFETAARLVRTVGGAAETLETREECYFASRVREGIYFVDFVHRAETATCTSVVLDLGRGVFTAVVGRLPEGAEARQPLLARVDEWKELTSVSAGFVRGAIDAPCTDDTPRHGVTDELIGLRVEYTYSPTERYEHLYLNENYYTWHCLKGSEKGLADTDRCHYYKLANRLYLFVWREKIVPTLGIVVVDLGAMKTTGKIFGYESGGSGGLANFPVGAHARVRNTTRREEPT